MIDTRKKDHFTPKITRNILAAVPLPLLSNLIEMADNHSFLSDRVFYAREHFPYGLSRSGEFTYEQAELLAAHGYAYEALADGSRSPVTEEEARFVKVCRGKCVAKSPHEKAWQQYCAKTKTPSSTYQSSMMGLNTGGDDLAEGVLDADVKEISGQ
ncbi:DUF413 domain-containing protein [bacterium]|nr:DUF413 domain-containing protein [bacterium]